MASYFGGSGIDDGPPYRYLTHLGWTERAGMLIAPKREIAQKEWDCVGFLCDEWDYGYDPALSQMQTMLAQITAPHFVAGIVLDDGTVTTAAPIVKYMIGWNRDRVRDYCHQKAWHIRIIQQVKQEG